MLLFVLGLILFLGIHSTRIFVPGLREVAIASRGENAWKGIYTIVSLIGFALLIYGYSIWRLEADILYVPPQWGRIVTYAVMLPAFILLVASQLKPGHIKNTVKHPQLIGVILWSAAHLTVNGDMATVTLMGAFLVWAILDTYSAFNRPATSSAEVKALPDIIAIVAGVALWAAFFVFLHEWLIGVAIVT